MQSGHASDTHDPVANVHKVHGEEHKIFMTPDGQAFPIPCWIDEDYTTVSVHDLPPEMTKRDIWAYGKVW